MSKRELTPDVKIVSEPQEPEHIQILRKGRAKIADPRHWTQGQMRREPTPYNPHERYCALGAIGWKEAESPLRGTPLMHATEALGKIVECINDFSPADHVTHFNDRGYTTHDDVLVMFDLAIEAATKDWLASR